MPSASGAILGTAFIDQNANGVFEAGEGTLPGLVVNLSGQSSQGVAVNTSTTTDKVGAFSFLNLPAGTFQISAGPVAGSLGGSPSFVGSNAAPGGDLVSGLTLAEGQFITQDLGFLGLAPLFISERLFLASTTPSDFPNTASPAGPGVSVIDQAPIVAAPIAAVSMPENTMNHIVDLAANFSDPDLANSLVRFNTSDGPLNVELFDAQTPQTVANFYDYIESGAFDQSIFSRLVPGFVLQGGGASLQTTPSGLDLVQIPTLPPIGNEFSTSNTVGTLAMAQSAGDPNSATDQFFFNLVNNNSTGKTNLDAQKFTVFGQVASAADQQTLLNTLAATPNQNMSSSPIKSRLPTVDLSNVPLNNYTAGPAKFPTAATASNFLLINSITVVRRDEFLTYSVVANNNPGLVTATIQNERLSLSAVPGQTGSAAITVRATDRFGATADDTFTVTVFPAPRIDSVDIALDDATKKVLTATAAANDPNSKPVTLVFQWLQNGNPIAGATTQNLNLSTQVADVRVGDKFAVRVTPKDDTMTGAPFTSDPVTIKTVNPFSIS